jgi:hypothetical protein
MVCSKIIMPQQRVPRRRRALPCALAALAALVLPRPAAADYLLTHMFPGAVCEGNETALSTFPAVECSISVGGSSSSSVTCVADDVAVVTTFPTPNCTGAGSNSTVPLGVCSPENGPGSSVASVSCLRGAPPPTVLDARPTFFQRVFNAGPAAVCPDPPKAAAYAIQAIWYATGACVYDTPSTDVSISCDPATGNASFAVYKRGAACTGAPVSVDVYPACGALGGDKSMAVVGQCSSSNKKGDTGV